MATRRAKASLEFLLVNAELSGIPEKGLLKSRNLVQVDLIWPRTGIAKRSAARIAAFRRGKVDFTGEPWTKRVVFREDVEGHCGLAVAVTEPVSIQKVRRFLRLTAKYALKMGADFMEKAMVGYADIASSPLDALAAMIGEKDAPKVAARRARRHDRREGCAEGDRPGRPRHRRHSCRGRGARGGRAAVASAHRQGDRFPAAAY